MITTLFQRLFLRNTVSKKVIIANYENMTFCNNAKSHILFNQEIDIADNFHTKILKHGEIFPIEIGKYKIKKIFLNELFVI